MIDTRALRQVAEAALSKPGPFDPAMHDGHRAAKREYRRHMFPERCIELLTKIEDLKREVLAYSITVENQAQEIAAMKNQEPCAIFLGWNEDGSAMLDAACEGPETLDGENIPLYLSAGAQPRDTEPAGHPDDLAVDRFALKMKEKLGRARSKGRSGWDDPEQCTTAYLSELLHSHVTKGDPVDVANFCMMLHQRGSGIDNGAQQEPVAWRKTSTGQLESAAAFAEPYNWGDKSQWEPLYTAPGAQLEQIEDLKREVVAIGINESNLKMVIKAANAQTEEFERKWYLACHEIESLKADAARYRFLVTRPHGGLFHPAFAMNGVYSWKTDKQYTAAIDQAIAAEGEANET